MARITVFVLALVAICCAAPYHTDDNNTGNDGEDQGIPAGGSEELHRMRRYLVGELGEHGHGGGGGGGGGFGGGYGGHGPHGHGGHGVAVPLSQSYSKSSASASSSSGGGAALLG